MGTILPYKIVKPLASSFRKGCSRKRRSVQIAPLRDSQRVAEGSGGSTAENGGEVKDEDGLEDNLSKRSPWGVRLLDSDEESEFKRQRLLAEEFSWTEGTAEGNPVEEKNKVHEEQEGPYINASIEHEKGLIVSYNEEGLKEAEGSLKEGEVPEEEDGKNFAGNQSEAQECERVQSLMVEEEVIDSSDPFDATHPVCIDEYEPPPCPEPLASQSGSTEEKETTLPCKSEARTISKKVNEANIAKTLASPSRPERRSRREKRLTTIEISDSGEDFETPRKSTKPIPFQNLKIGRVHSPSLVRRALAYYRDEKNSKAGRCSKARKRPRNPVVIDLEGESQPCVSPKETYRHINALVKVEVKTPSRDQLARSTHSIGFGNGKQEDEHQEGIPGLNQTINGITSNAIGGAPKRNSKGPDVGEDMEGKEAKEKSSSQLKLKKPEFVKQRTEVSKRTGVFERFIALKSEVKKKRSSTVQRSQITIDISGKYSEENHASNVEASQKSPGVRTKKKVYHLRSFEYVMDTTVSRHRHLLTKKDMEHVEAFKNLSENARRLYVRLYRRKLFKWFRAEDLEKSYMEEIDVNAAIKELSTMDIMRLARSVRSDEAEHKKKEIARNILPVLKLYELREAAKSQWDRNVLKKKKRAALEFAFRGRLKTCSTAETRKKPQSFQRTIDGNSSELLLAMSILRIARTCVRLNWRQRNTFQRIHFLFFLEDGADSPRALLAYAGRTRFADYVVPGNAVSPLFQSSTSLYAYECARKAESKLEAAQEASGEAALGEALEIGNTAERYIQKFYSSMSTSELSQLRSEGSETLLIRSDLVSIGSAYTSAGYSDRRTSDEWPRLCRETRKQLQHPFLRRFTSVWVHARIAWHSISTLEKRKNYPAAVARLKLLLQTGLCPLRHGKWINRLTIDLDRHLKDKNAAYDLCLETLRNTSRYIHIGDKVALAKRAEKLHRSLHRPGTEELLRTEANTKKQLKSLVDDHLKETLDPAIRAVLENRAKMPQRKIHGKALPKSKLGEKEAAASSDKIPWGPKTQILENEEKRNPTGMKSMFASFTNKTMAVTVEQLVLEVYAAEGWKGMHCESAAIRFLFTILMWDILFMDVNDVFQTPFQNAPLDLQTEAFYMARKSVVEHRLGKIKTMSKKELKEEIETCYEKNKNTTVIGGQWDRFSQEDSVSLAVSIGGRTLERTCRLLATDYGYWSGGFPDLVLWKMANASESEDGILEGQAKFVEVKSERDTLSERQSAWIRELVDSGADAEMCRVSEKKLESGGGDVDGYGIDRIEEEYEYVTLDL